MSNTPLDPSWPVAARAYPVTIQPDPDEGYIALVPGFEHTIFTNGDTPEEALTNAYDAIALTLEWHAERGQAPPAPPAPARAA